MARNGRSIRSRLVDVYRLGLVRRWRAFSKTCGEGKTISEIASTALDLLKNAELREAVVAESQELARERLSFQTVRSQLANLFANAQGTSAIDP